MEKRLQAPLVILAMERVPPARKSPPRENLSREMDRAKTTGLEEHKVKQRKRKRKKWFIVPMTMRHLMDRTKTMVLQ